MSCNIVTYIPGSQCIGDSLETINNNFDNLETVVCRLSTAGFVPVTTDTIAPTFNTITREFTNNVRDLSITSGKLANNAVTAGKLSVGAVQQSFSDTSGAYTFRNRLINAQGLINQRVYVSGTATTVANQYTLDRWRVVTSGQSLTFSTSENVTTFTAPASGVEQVIEGLNIESGVYELNWTGTATATVNGTPIQKGGNITLVGGSNTTVRFINGTFSLPQLERGTVSTSFEYRPIGLELSLCQRYYEKSYDINTAIGALRGPSPGGNGGYQALYVNDTIPTNNGFGAITPYKIPKRAIPTVNIYSYVLGTLGQFSNYREAGQPNRPAAAVNIGTNAFDIWNTGTALTNPIPVFHWTAEAEL